MPAGSLARRVGRAADHDRDCVDLIRCHVSLTPVVAAAEDGDNAGWIMRNSRRPHHVWIHAQWPQRMAERTDWQLRLVTLNCFGLPYRRDTRARLGTIGRELNRPELDVLCLQEVFSLRSARLLRDALTEFPYAAYERLGWAPKGGLLTVSRWPITRRQFTVYRRRGRWYTIALADHLIGKGLLLTTITTPAAAVVVVNTHLLANYDEDWSPRNDYARQQRTELAQLAHAVQQIDASVPVVVAGDLNVPRDSWLYDGFVRATGLENVLEGASQASPQPRDVTGRRVPALVDYILARRPPGAELRTAAGFIFQQPIQLVDGRRDYLSDHLGIEASITGAVRGLGSL